MGCPRGASGTHTKPTATLQGSLTRGAAGPSQGSNTEGEQSSIVLLPVALTLKVGREDSQAVLFPHPVPPSVEERPGSSGRWGREGRGLPLSPVGTHSENLTRVPLEALGTPLPLLLQPPHPPACHWWLLWALDTPLRSARQKGTVPLLLREWRLLLEDYLSQTQTPSLLPSCGPFPLQGAQALSTPT